MGVNIQQLSVDENLMYALQNLTGDKPNELIEYFYFLAQQAADYAFTHGTGKRISIKIRAPYKNTSIFYKLDVFSSDWGVDLVATRKRNGSINCFAKLTMSQKLAHYNGSEIIGMAAENTLLDGANKWPEFTEPRRTIPRGLKGKI